MGDTLRARVRLREKIFGSWLNLGSSITAEIAAHAGFDWLLLDGEHGFSDYNTLLHQLQAIGGSPTAPIVRLPWNDQAFMKRVLDLGPAGIMIPMVNTAVEAEAAARAFLYPPDGTRGLAKLTRSSGYLANFPSYFATESRDLILICQIETPEAVANIDAIAAVERVDVLFVGPTDLSVNLGLLDKTEDPRFQDALRKVVDAAKSHGKAAGVLTTSSEIARDYLNLGFTFVATSSDMLVATLGMRAVAKELNALR